MSGLDTDSEVGETFKLTEPPLTPQLNFKVNETRLTPQLTPRKSFISAFSDDLLNCQLCHNRFRNPKSLSCLHSFCETCLDIYISKLPGPKNPEYFPCPVCRELNSVPVHLSVNRTGYQATEKMSALVPLSSRSSISGDPIDKADRAIALIPKSQRRCDPCNENSDYMVALYWCPTCREALCDNCTKSHRGMKITRTHALMDIDDVRERPTRMLQSHEMCPDHRGKLLDMYCREHQTTVCATCIALNHRRCDIVQDSDQIAKTTKSTRRNTKTYAQRLRNCITVVENVLAAKEASKSRLVAKKEMVLEEVSKLKVSIIQHLEELEDRMKDEVDTVSRDYEDVLQTKIDRSRGLRDSIQSTLSVMQNTMDSGTEYQQAVTTQTMRDECEKYEAMVDEERIDYKEVDFLFTPDENVLRLVKLLDRFGFVEISEKRQLTKAFKNCSAHKDGVISGRTKGDRNSCIFNSVDISEMGEILLSDYNNCSVKLYDQFGMYRSTTKLNSPPRGVCMFPDKIAAISLPEEGMIKLMSFEGKFLSHVRELHTSFKAFRICNFRTKLLGICYTKACRSLAVIERTGRVERTITRKRDFKGLGGVAYDPLKSHLYMSDRDAITCFNAAGKQVYHKTYRRTDLRGMALDCQGNLYVCSHDSGQVLQISSDGDLIKSILVPISPQDVAIEPMGNKMVVVGLGEAIHVYNLS